MITIEQQRRYREKYNPDGSLLRQDQLQLLEMLCFVADIFEKHNIEWWLSAGTLLGAARHGGFIPWDDDMDIEINIKDLKRAEQILLSLNHSEYTYHCKKSDNEYILYFGKFRKRNGCIKSSNKRTRFYKWAGIGFDIFSLEKSSYSLSRLSEYVYNKPMVFTERIKNKYIRRALIALIQIPCDYIIFPLFRALNIFVPKKKYHYRLGTQWSNISFNDCDIYPLGKISFEGITMPAPNNVDSYLTSLYGEWKKIPSDEFIRHSIHCEEYKQEIMARQQN